LDITKVLLQIITYGRWQANRQLLDFYCEIKKKEGRKMTRALTEIEEKVGGEVVLGREELFAVLERAATESEFLAQLAENPHEALKEYYSLTSEERAALASGDIKKIESWVGKLDKELATWLWCRLSQEKW
jgi:hypothetical protein